MIVGAHANIRLAETDDARFIHGLYVHGPVRAALLDARREMPLPVLRDIREMLEKKDVMRGLLYSIEDKTGRLCGFCALRGLNYEARYAEVALVLEHEDGYRTLYAAEAWQFLMDRAFHQYRLAKVITMCLETEGALRNSLEQLGFAACGRQREAVYTGGRWHDLYTYELFHATNAAAPAMTHAGSDKS